MPDAIGWCGLAAIAVGLVAVAVQLAPPVDSGFATGWDTAWSAPKARSLVRNVVRAFAPVPAPGPAFWESELLERSRTFVATKFGVGLTIFEKYAPKSVKPYIPSPLGIGIAMIVPFSNSLMMFLGAAVAEVIRRRFKRFDRYTVPVASGLIAGESLVGIGIIIATKVFGL